MEVQRRQVFMKIFGRITNKSGYEVKEEVQDWMCDKRRELAANMSIAFSQKKLNVIAWMSNVEKDDYPADEFVIYLLCRLYDVHCIMMTKYEPWSTISRQFSMAVDDVWAKSDLRLVMLEPGCYGEIKNIQQPPSAPPPSSISDPAPTATPSKHASQSRNKPKTTNRGNVSKPLKKKERVSRSRSSSGEKSASKPHTLQESRDLKYGLQTSRPVRKNRRKIDYCKLNDGLEEPASNLPSPKRAKRSPLPSRSGPSYTRISTQNSPPPKSSPKQGTKPTNTSGAETFIGVTGDKGVPELVGVTNVTPKSVETTKQSDSMRTESVYF